MKAQLGIIGLGRIGANLARLGLRRKLRLAGYTRGTAPRIGRGFTVAPDIPTLCSLLEKPRRVILWVPAGKAVDELIDALTAVVGAAMSSRMAATRTGVIWIAGQWAFTDRFGTLRKFGSRESP